MAVKRVRLRVRHDGSQYVACLIGPGYGVNTKGHKREVNPEYEQFKIFYGEAKEKKITKAGMLEYITEKFVELYDDIFDVPDIDTLSDYLKRYVSALHKRVFRYHQKAYLNDWNYFVTFTYSDAKMTAAEFERQITTKLSDLSSHSDWRYMMRWEQGELGDRKHLHAFLYVPEGKMVGELFKDHHYSTKRHKQEFFTNNTYFNERFGTSDWKELTSLKGCKKLVNYLIKYMAKDDGKIIYSRGIPTVVEAEIDLENDVITRYDKNECVYVVVDPRLFMKPRDKATYVSRAYDVDRIDVEALLLPI